MVQPDYEWMGERQTPLKVAFGLVLLSSTLSLVGSGAIVYTIMRHRSHRMLYHRLVLGLSFTDIFATLVMASAVFAVPQSTGLQLAFGNTNSCTASGFLFTFAIAPYIYNAELSLYFLAVLRFKWREDKIAAVMEPYIHILPWVVPTIGSTVFASMGALNPDSLFGLCDIGPYPPGCDQFTPNTCERGGQFHFAFYIFSALGLLVVFTGIAATWLVCRTVLKQNATVRRHSFTGVRFQVQERRQRDMMMQSVLYTVIFTMLSVAFVAPIFADRSLRSSVRNQKKIQMSILLGYFFFMYPIQGFLNGLIYLRLRIRSWKQVEPSKGFAWAVTRAVLEGPPTPDSRASMKWKSQAILKRTPSTIEGGIQSLPVGVEGIEEEKVSRTSSPLSDNSSADVSDSVEQVPSLE